MSGVSWASFQEVGNGYWAFRAVRNSWWDNAKEREQKSASELVEPEI
jgi:hypothetical protein